MKALFLALAAAFSEDTIERTPVTRRGTDLYLAQPPGDRPAIPFRILPGADGKGELLQMFLWLFKKDEVAP
jgi:hypothetical protein